MPTSTSSATTVTLVTPCGEGGISVIHLAGPDTPAILERVFRRKGREARGATGSLRPVSSPAPPEGMRTGPQPVTADPRRIHYGTAVDRAGEVLDEVIVRAGPDRAEINCHGGVVVTRRVIDRLIELGAVETETPPPATADAIVAEALGALPMAQTGLVAAILLDQYHGALSRVVHELVRGIEGGCAMEATREMGRLLATARVGLRLIDPPRVVIAGRPNVGKSSLLNALVGRSRALVHEAPGTTRDYVDTTAVIGGLPVSLFDTAGVGPAADALEEAGMKRAVEQAAKADLVVVLFDASTALTPADRALGAQLVARPVIAVLNKVDLPVVISEDEVTDLVGVAPWRVSARSGEGLGGLGRRIADQVFGSIPGPGAAVVFTPRQRDLIRSALALPESAPTILRRLLAGDDT